MNEAAAYALRDVVNLVLIMVCAALGVALYMGLAGHAWAWPPWIVGVIGGYAVSRYKTWRYEFGRRRVEKAVRW